MSNLDLNSLPPDLQATLNRKETDGERRIRLIKDLAVFSFAITVLAIAVVWAGFTIVSSTSPAPARQTAQTVIVAVISGLLGYLVRK